MPYPPRNALSDFGHDLHHGLRVVRRNPGYAATAMLCLALGIGVNATVFSFLDGVYFRLLPVPEADRVVAIDRNGSAPCFWRDCQALRGLDAFSGVAAAMARGTFMDVDHANFRIVAETVSANYADVLRLKPAIGRWFLPADEVAGAEPVVVIGAHLWDSWFRRDPGVLGRYVRIELERYRIVGVAPENFRGVSPPVRVDAWLPLATFPITRAQLADPHTPGPAVNLVGRLAPHNDPARANAEIAVAGTLLRQANPHEASYTTPLTVRVFRGITSAESRRSMRSISILLLAVVGTVLLIACVNVANLLLSRAAVRQREMALRRSLGASRGRLVRQGLAESVILALGGAALGLLFGHVTDRALSLWLPASLPESFLRGVSLQMNWRVAVFTTAVALVCAVLFSLAPALEGSSVDLIPALKSDVRPGRGGRPRVLPQRDLYVIAQVALSLVLLIAAGLLLRALQRTAQIDPGFATDHRLYLRLFAPEPDFTPESATQLFTRVLDQARALPGVRDATLSFDVLGFSDGECVSTERGSSGAHAGINVVEPNYFSVMRIPLVRGRNFDADEQPVLDTPKGLAAGAPPLAIIVNQTMARQQWPGRDPVGKALWLGCLPREPQMAAQVIGVARDSKYGSLDEGPRPFFYASRRQLWWNGFFALILHTAGDPRTLAAPLIQLARAAGPNLRMYELRTFDDSIELSLWRVRWQASLLGAFGLLAIVLSVVGLYGVVAYTVAQRTHEIGIRMALGAQRTDVQWMVLARGLRLTAAGIAMGLVLSAAATRFLRGFLYGVDPLDPVAFTAAAMLWILIATLASYLPAQRAARVDPAIALRDE
ncbi:MAG TPA: ABC transporter permease [Bryobacteraceae bacterium]|nr:ABC transporter permease [Bryobacteraceae bacterium]